MVGAARVLAFGAALASASPAFAFDPWGVWVREASGTTFDFYNCAGKLCAKVIGVGKPEEKNAIGTVILRNAALDKEGVWRGEIYNTQDGKTYKGGVTLEKPDELTLEGCLIGFLCKSEIWKRAEDQSKASTPGGKPAMPAPSPKPGLGH
ncbi:MAG TPA: DUF2147 domain-containing protein [Rhodoblastus sp.]|nr:DUF2147 domain-containing protein [Rhodoblastus sp.]